MVSIPLNFNKNYVHSKDDGIKRVEFKPSMLLYQIPRAFADNLQYVGELKSAGIYFLVKNTVPSIYVGQADNHDDGSGVFKRMMGGHAEGIDDWDFGYILTSGTPNYLQATELNWLEQTFYDKAKAAGRYKVLNGPRPHANEPDYTTKQNMEVFVDNALFLLPRELQMFAFEGPNSEILPAKLVDNGLIGRPLFLSIKKHNVYAAGTMTGYKTMYVYPGAMVRPENKLLRQKGMAAYGKQREELEKAGIIHDSEISGYEFDNPSQAACIIAGASMNGNTAWHDKNGVTLGELKDRISSDEDLSDSPPALSDETEPALPPEIDPDLPSDNIQIPLADNDTSEHQMLYIDRDSSNTHAKGYMNGEKTIMVLKGSKVSDTVRLQFQKGAAGRAKNRQDLENDGTIANGVFTRDHEFPTVSNAASVILGTSSSGNAEWKTKDGVTLGELKKQAV